MERERQTLRRWGRGDGGEVVRIEEEMMEATKEMAEVEGGRGEEMARDRPGG